MYHSSPSYVTVLEVLPASVSRVLSSNVWKMSLRWLKDTFQTFQLLVLGYSHRDREISNTNKRIKSANRNASWYPNGDGDEPEPEEPPTDGPGGDGDEPEPEEPPTDDPNEWLAVLRAPYPHMDRENVVPNDDDPYYFGFGAIDDLDACLERWNELFGAIDVAPLFDTNVIQRAGELLLAAMGTVELPAGELTATERRTTASRLRSCCIQYLATYLARYGTLKGAVGMENDAIVRWALEATPQHAATVRELVPILAHHLRKSSRFPLECDRSHGMLLGQKGIYPGLSTKSVRMLNQTLEFFPDDNSPLCFYRQWLHVRPNAAAEAQAVVHNPNTSGVVRELYQAVLNL